MKAGGKQMYHVPSKCQLTFNRIFGIMSQKTEVCTYCDNQTSFWMMDIGSQALVECLSFHLDSLDTTREHTNGLTCKKRVLKPASQIIGNYETQKQGHFHKVTTILLSPPLQNKLCGP
jgi:hypothetical protein